MDEKQAIISQILSTAEATAKNIVEGAKAEQDRVLSEKAALDEKKNSATKSRAEAAAEESIKRSEMLARLDSKKNLLNIRQKAISEVYLLVEDKLRNLSNEKYCKLFEGYISKYAHSGDKISICKNDEKRLNDAWLNSCASKNGLKLSFADNHNYKGGIIIRGQKCDINCTLEAMVSEARVNTEKKVAEILFGNNG